MKRATSSARSEAGLAGACGPQQQRDEHKLQRKPGRGECGGKACGSRRYRLVLTVHDNLGGQAYEAREEFSVE